MKFIYENRQLGYYEFFCWVFLLNFVSYIKNNTTFDAYPYHTFKLDRIEYLLKYIFEDELSVAIKNLTINPKDFFRVRRKFLIPLKAVKEIQVYSNSRLKINLPTYKADEVIVSREKVSDFKLWIG